MTTRLIKRVPRCPGCHNRIDPDWCHCGDSIESHTLGTGHGPVPIGCTCGYEKPIKPVKRIPRYSLLVEERLKPDRPQYNEAVKSLAAFAPDERKFCVLMSHLDAACQEARTSLMLPKRK